MLPGEEIIHVLPQEFKVDGQAEIKNQLECMEGVWRQIFMSLLDKFLQ